MRKTMLATVITVVLAVVATGTALATPPSGLTSLLLARGAAGEFRIHDASMQLNIRARQPTDVAVVQATLEPGGSTGWHGHPGPSIVIVKSGTLTMSEPHRRECVEHTYGPGSAFAHPEDVHNFVNKNSEETVEFYVTYFVPAGAAPLLLDKPAPAECV